MSAQASLLERVAQGVVTRATDEATLKFENGVWVDTVLGQARTFISSHVEDPALASALNAALNVLEESGNREVLRQVTQEAFTVFVTRLGAGTRGLAREEYLRNFASFDERHALLQADIGSAIDATDKRTALLNAIETIAIEMLARGGAALAPFFLSLL